jgi:fucose permease
MATSNVLANPVARLGIYLAFALTGAVTNLIGPLAPEMQSAWRMSDEQIGQLFSWQFATSTLATLLVGRWLRVSAPVGLALIAIGVWLLGHAPNQNAAVAVATYGAGLGLAIPSINLLIATSTGREQAGSELALLNAFWVLGAAGFPFLLAMLPHARGTALLDAIALTSAAACIFTAWTFGKAGNLEPAEPIGAFRSDSVLFALFFFLYVGAEVGISGWLPAHADRATRSVIGSRIVLAFWGSLLLGRFLTSSLVRRIDQKKILLGSIAVGTIAATVLALAHSEAIILLAAVTTGAAFAPLFPVNLALFTLAGHRAGWVLACAGLGAAVIPWLMGVISTQTGSLRYAVLLPIISLVLLFAIALAYQQTAATVSSIESS